MSILFQVQFLLGLETISNRLLVVPRPARVSALRAELTNLNHKLPAEVSPDVPPPTWILQNILILLRPFRSGLYSPVV